MERLHFHFSLSCIGEGNGNPLQCSCLKNPRDRGAWWAAVYGVAPSRTRLKRLSSSSSMWDRRNWGSSISNWNPISTMSFLHREDSSHGRAVRQPGAPDRCGRHACPPHQHEKGRQAAGGSLRTSYSSPRKGCIPGCKGVVGTQLGLQPRTPTPGTEAAMASNDDPSARQGRSKVPRSL